MTRDHPAAASDTIYDVVQIGYGPVSQILALMLARKGWRVAVFERWKKRYPLPRAVCIDHEMARMLHVLGMRDNLRRVSHPAPPYRWFNADWTQLLYINWEADAISGGTEVNFVHQPTLEEMYDETVSRNALIDVSLGQEAIAITQAQDHAEVTVRDVDSGVERHVRARFVIGTDGANSIVRKMIGAAQEDFGFKADWLVIDILPNEDAVLDIPPAAQWCNPERPTTIVPAGIRDGRYYRRWEFMRLPHETVAELEDDAIAWRLLAPWVKPHQATMVRNKVYTFRSLVATGWRQGRVLIAGDAAHVMPPFMGQGMCSGFRDDWNLVWKLDLVLKGEADLRILDTYESERRPHVKEIIAISMYLGKVICIPDPVVAAERDRSLIEGTAPPPPAFPHLVDGILDRDATGVVRGPAGLLCPQDRIKLDGREGWFDDLVGAGFVLIARDDDPLATFDDRQHAVMRALDIKAVTLARDGARPPRGQAVDQSRRTRGFMEAHSLAAMIVRPDFYLYGGTSTAAGAGALVEGLAAELGAHGLRAFEREPAASVV